MREWIQLVEAEAESNEDFSFVEALTKLVGVDKEKIEEIIEGLDVDELSDLVDATMRGDKSAAIEIIGDEKTESNDLENKEDEEDDDINSLLIPSNKVKKIKAKLRNLKKGVHEEEQDDGDIVYNIGDPVIVDGHECTVKVPSGPGNSVGVMIDGELKMVNKNKVHIKEGVLGMTAMPGLRPSADADSDLARMRKLAGIHDEAPATEAEFEPTELSFDDHEEPEMETPFGAPSAPMPEAEPEAPMGMGMPGLPSVPALGSPMEDVSSAATIDKAISDIEEHINEVTLGEYKSIVARLKALVSMAENAGRAALTESRRKIKENKAKEEAMKEDAISKADDLKPKKKKEEPKTDGEVTRKTLMDYIKEQDELETIGMNKNDAIKAIQSKMGPGSTPQGANQAFTAMMGTGKIKQQNGSFKMTPMDDQSFKNELSTMSNTANNQQNNNQQPSQNTPNQPNQAIQPR